MKRHLILLLAAGICSIVSACAGSGGIVSPSAVPEEQVIEQTSMLLPDPGRGLDALASYHMHFEKMFTGEADGIQVHSSLEMDADEIKADQVRFVTMKEEDETGTSTRLLQGRVANAYYSKSREPKSLCKVTWDDTNQLTPVFRPVDMLPKIFTAKRVGAETINSIPVIHYTLDTKSFGKLDVEQLTGGLWLAEPGGYVVKLLMTINGTDRTFGNGRSGSQTINYELTRINSNTQFILPEGCPMVLTGIPVMPDAEKVSKYPDTMRYLTSSSMESILAFYKEKLEADGWKSANAHPFQDGGKIQMFIHSEKPESLLLDITRAGTKQQVNIARLQPAVRNAESTLPSKATPAPADTMDPSKSGLPAEIPLYTGAENFKGIAGIRMTFDVRDPMDTVKTFYKDAMRKASWSQIPGTENVPGAPLMFKKGDSTIIIQITEENGVTTVAITKAK